VEHLTELAHYVAEVANLAPEAQPTVRGTARLHAQGRLHTSGVARCPRAYEHIDPEAVGNRAGVVASDYGGGPRSA
jgi:2-isopropylmalate synthase